MNLAEMLRAECEKSPNVEMAMVSPNGGSFVVQAVVGWRGHSDPEHKGWLAYEPVYAPSAALLEINGIAKRVKSKHPDALAYIVSYTFRQASWKEVYRRAKSRHAPESA
jgi:hypothetical protein